MMRAAVSKVLKKKLTGLAVISILLVLINASFSAEAQVVGAPVPQSVNISFLEPSLVNHTITLVSNVPFSTKIGIGTTLANGRVEWLTGSPGTGIALRWENPSGNCFTSELKGANNPENILTVNLFTSPSGLKACDAQGYMNPGSAPGSGVKVVNYSLRKLTTTDVPADTYTATIYAASWQN